MSPTSHYFNVETFKQCSFFPLLSCYKIIFSLLLVKLRSVLSFFCIISIKKMSAFSVIDSVITFLNDFAYIF